MRTIYVDSDFRCHAADETGSLVALETEVFDGKCDAFLEGYRFVPDGETWTRQNGTVFRGKMIAPWKDYAILKAYQEQYEAMRAEMEDMQAALTIVGVTPDE